MNDSFQLVERKRQRKRNKNFFEVAATFESENFSSKKIEQALEEFESSRFCFELLQTIDESLRVLGSNSINEIICFGIGNFLEKKSSLHQLAGLIKLHKNYQSVVTVYDPVFSSLEIKALKKLNFNVLTDNEEGKRKVSSNQITLVFLPHCPKQLTNNFLWANWNTSLCSCILIANSFSRIIDDNSKQTLKDSANFILKIQPKTKEILLDQCYHFADSFNDISVHYFKHPELQKAFFIDTIEEEPEYSDDIELIKKVQELSIKNE